MSDWTTTPNSPLANEMLETALKSGSLHRIGASAHAYADTWAHQNFLGKDDGFNEMRNETFAERVEGVAELMRIGHALAGHLPDIPGLIWDDARLIVSEIDNTTRFMDAADHLFRKLALHKDPSISQAALHSTSTSLVADLRSDIGPSSRSSRQQDATRIERYKERGLTAPYGGTAIPEYREGKWADEAFVEQRADLKQRIAIYLEREVGTAGDLLGFSTSIPCTWKDTETYQQTDWWKFQQAVRSHLDECWAVLKARLPDLS